MKILYTLFMAIGLVLSASTLALANHGGPNCRPYEKVVFEEFFADYGESVVFKGFAEDGKSVLHVLMNPVTGTYTILVADGINICQVTAGQGGETTKPRVPGEEA